MSSIAIPQRQAFVGVPERGLGAARAMDGGRRHVLRPVEQTRESRTAGPDAYAWRRFLVVLVMVLATVLAAAGAFASQVTGPTLAERTDGHVMMAPHQSLWEVAALMAPTGVDPATQLAAIESVNAGTIGEGGSWRVVLLPAW